MRLTVTRKSDLALRALRAVAAHEGVVRGEELAQTIGTTRAFLGQVITPLVRARWIVSSPGPLGGYRLGSGTVPSVLDVIEAIEGPVDMRTCVLDSESACVSTRPGTRSACALHDPWVRAQEAMRQELSRSPAIPDVEGTPGEGRPGEDPREVSHVP